jgi:hypothetical protein
MLLRKLRNSPEKMIPVAMALIAIGLSLTTIGITWPRFSPLLPHTGTNWNDFTRGVFFGVAIFFEVAGVAIAAQAAAAKKRKAL